MGKIFFSNDYNTGCHPNILKALVDTNLMQSVGYSEDLFCCQAREKIKIECNNDLISVFFLVGGTQTNSIYLANALKPYQGILCAKTAHIATHETGAIESRSHKVLTIKTDIQGKINYKDIDEYCNEHFSSEISCHMVQPGGVYISQPTENGGLYKKDELINISKVCKKYGIFLYVDGARLGYALSSKENDIDLPLLTELCDSFYIGGTKCGALMGEALIIKDPKEAKDFRYCIKQGGGLLAKGRFLGLQFNQLFTDNLYIDICKKADEFASKIAQTFVDSGFKLFCNSYTNQQFVILDNKIFEKLSEKYEFTFWEKYSENESVIRICTSWSTTDEMVNSLINDIKSL